MVRAEQSHRRKKEEEERKKRLNLLLFSPLISHKILTQEGKKPLEPELPADTLSAFQKGSVRDRAHYWEDREPTKNYGQQMAEWLGRGEKPGIAQWVKRQEATDVVGILESVGLKGSSEATKKSLEEPRVAHLLGVIDNDLQRAGDAPLGDLSEEEARSLIFYTQYLNSQEKSGAHTKAFIDTLVTKASALNAGNPDATIATLQQITPLLQVAGIEGQHALGALLVAKAHALNSQDLLENIAPDATLNTDEQQALAFLKKNREYPLPEPLTEGEPHAIVEVFQNIQPEVDLDNLYLVEKDIPKDFAKSLSPEQIQQLELTKTYWIPEGDNKLRLNPNVFMPQYDLADNARFQNAFALTDAQSGLFALAAASAKTPEQQVALFQMLGETILRVHAENPQLLTRFLEAQMPESLAKLREADENIAHSYRGEAFNQAQEKLLYNFEEKFGKKSNHDTLTPEEKAYLDEENVTLASEFNNRTLDIMSDITQSPDRLVVLTPFEAEPNEFERFPVRLDISATAAAWPERVAQLQEALRKNPLTLTTDQINQIEFLAHSVDTVQVLQLLKNKDILHTTVRAQEEILPAENTVEPLLLRDFFLGFENIDQQQFPGRQEFATLDSTHLSQFSTHNEDILRYEVTSDRGDLLLYSGKRDTTGKFVLDNDRNMFLGPLMEEGSLSRRAYDSLHQQFGQSTLLAFTLESAATTDQREALFKNLFLQIANMYMEHPNLRGDYGKYLTALPADSTPWNQDYVAQRLGSENNMRERLTLLTAKLQENKELSLQDFQDMSFYSLPLNLQLITNRMKLAYKMQKEKEDYKGE